MALRRSTSATMVGYLIQTTNTEGFAPRPLFIEKEGQGPQRCGIDLPPCLPRNGSVGWEGVRCMNGWCRSDRP
jgi:hypothetical protein